MNIFKWFRDLFEPETFREDCECSFCVPCNAECDKIEEQTDMKDYPKKEKKKSKKKK